MYIGNSAITQYYVGGTLVDRIYQGDTIVYEKNPGPTPIDYSEQYLTFEILSAGTIVWQKNSAIAEVKTVTYSINDGAWISLNSATGTNSSFNVVAGDIVRFKGGHDRYTRSSTNYSSFGSSTATFNIYGNIMSLIGGDNFKTLDTLTTAWTFFSLFKGTQVISAQNLILPATALTNYCYREMFLDCTSLTTAPVLSAATLATHSYFKLFSGCTNLNYIKCLATDLGDSGTGSWTDGVSATGTFVKAASMTGWTTGANGIPSNWTVQDA